MARSIRRPRSLTSAWWTSSTSTSADLGRPLAAEVVSIEAVERLIQPVEQQEIARPGALLAEPRRPARNVLFHRKRQQLPLGGPTDGPRQARVEEPDDGAE